MIGNIIARLGVEIIAIVRPGVVDQPLALGAAPVRVEPKTLVVAAPAVFLVRLEALGRVGAGVVDDVDVLDFARAVAVGVD